MRSAVPQPPDPAEPVGMSWDAASHTWGACAAPGLGPGQRDRRQPLLTAVKGQDGVFPGSLNFSVRRWVGSHPLP